MRIDKKDLDNWFRYHPVQSEKRRQAHQNINYAARKFAEAVLANVHDQTCIEMAFYAIQQARMFANQGATLDEICPAAQRVDEAERKENALNTLYPERPISGVLDGTVDGV